MTRASASGKRAELLDEQFRKFAGFARQTNGGRAGADGFVIELDDGDDVLCGDGDEGLVRGGGELGGEGFFFDGQADVAGGAEDEFAGYGREDVGL